MIIKIITDSKWFYYDNVIKVERDVCGEVIITYLCGEDIKEDKIREPYYIVKKVEVIGAE